MLTRKQLNMRNPRCLANISNIFDFSMASISLNRAAVFKNEVLHYMQSLGVEVEDHGAAYWLPAFKVSLVLHFVTTPTDEELHSLGAPSVHIWQDVWITKRKVVESRLRSLVGQTQRIHGRATHVVKLTNPELLHFLAENHLNEPIPAKFKYGLTQAGRLVAVASFSDACPIHRDNQVYQSHQLLRFCSLNGTTVVGGLSKLLSHFVHTHPTDDIMTYADLDWAKGKGYEQLGFKQIGSLPPQTFTVNPLTFKRTYISEQTKPTEGSVYYKNSGSIKYLLDFTHA